MSDLDRRTGRTYSAVASAVDAARAGRTALYVVHNERMRGYVRDMLHEHFAHGITHSGDLVTRYGAGEVRITLRSGIERAMRGSRDVAVVYDHASWEFS